MDDAEEKEGKKGADSDADEGEEEAAAEESDPEDEGDYMEQYADDDEDGGSAFGDDGGECSNREALGEREEKSPNELILQFCMRWAIFSDDGETM
jgi:hypothetical protein